MANLEDKVIHERVAKLRAGSRSSLAIADGASAVIPYVENAQTTGEGLYLSVKIFSEKAKYLELQAKNIETCPSNAHLALKDPDLSPYPKASGLLLFHQGGIGFLSNASKNQRECIYDKNGKLQLGWSEGTINEYSNNTDSLKHTFLDSGGIFSANGLRGMLVSLPGIIDAAISEVKSKFSGMKK
jgi:hypothetical protein